MGMQEVRNGKLKEFYTLMGKVYNDSFSEEQLFDLVETNEEISEVLANYEKTPVKLLDKLSKSTNWRVRCHVALNRNTSTDTLYDMKKTETHLLILTAVCQELDIRNF